jgi:hypothetical protein
VTYKLTYIFYDNEHELDENSIIYVLDEINKMDKILEEFRAERRAILSLRPSDL